MKQNSTPKNKLPFLLLSFFLLLLTLLPLWNGCLPDNRMNSEWSIRIQELSAGFSRRQLYLYPSPELFINSGIYDNIMNSNFWLLFPALVYFFTGRLLLARNLFMILLQLGTLITAALFFNYLFTDRPPAARDQKSPVNLPVAAGIVLYMTCPYRIFLCYDVSNLFEAIVWMLLPLYVMMLAHLLSQQRAKIITVLLSSFLLAGIGYSHLILYLTIAALTCLAGILLRKFRLLLPVLFSTVITLPCLYRLAAYLFGNFAAGWNLPLQSIMKNGYLPGQFFSSYAFRDGHPGMGLGLLTCLFAGIWLSFVAGQKISSRLYRPALVLFLLLTLLSLSSFPWDLVQRLGLWALKLVSLIGSPAIFWGLGLAVFALPAALIIEYIRQQESKWAAMLLPYTALLLSAGICLHQCYTLMKAAVPLLLP